MAGILAEPRAFWPVGRDLLEPTGLEGSRPLYNLVLATAKVTSISTGASAGGGATEQVSIGGTAATLTYHT